MKTKIIFNKLVPSAFNLLRVNTVLVMPLLIFLLLLVVIFSPVGSANIFVMVAILALKSVFLSGWLNMFHMCIENNKNDALSDEEKTFDSLDLYKAFFPGVGKYFHKIFWGILLYILIINLVEAAIFHFLGHFESFSLNNLPKNIESKADLISFFEKISPADKISLIKLTTVYLSFIFFFSYLIMFWPQLVIVEDKNPIKAFGGSIKTVLSDPLNTFLIFGLAVLSFVCILGLNFILGRNILGQLLFLMLSTYGTVYFLIMSFLYFERYR